MRRFRRIKNSAKRSQLPESQWMEAPQVLTKDALLQALTLERKRSERSGLPFLLMRVELNTNGKQRGDRSLLLSAINAMSKAARDTDIVGWYLTGVTAAAIYTGVSHDLKSSAEASIGHRLMAALQAEISDFAPEMLRVTFHIFPDQWEHSDHGNAPDLMMYPDSSEEITRGRTLVVAKRVIDVCGSLVLLLFSAPLMVLIAVGVKLSSKGPVFFKQARVGMYGREFTFLKFRSMYINSDTAVHRQYVRNMIASNNEGAHHMVDTAPIYKLANDKRITRIGRLLRRTSLDELPQLINVLRGDMSLVGPRPPIPYEIDAYKPWHRSRYLLVQPGITGLWQVTARSRVCFDDMVRLDLRYVMTWSLWMDIKLLLQTPAALLRGAY